MSYSVPGCQFACVYVCAGGNWSFPLVKCPNVRAPHASSPHRFATPPRPHAPADPTPMRLCLSFSRSLYPLVVHKDSALSCQMELPEPGSHHLDNHFLLFAFYVDLIIFHLQRDGNHKLRCVPYAFAEIKHGARITESANGGKTLQRCKRWAQSTEILQSAARQDQGKESNISRDIFSCQLS